jgi:hypothetical protein
MKREILKIELVLFYYLLFLSIKKINFFCMNIRSLILNKAKNLFENT